MTITDRAHASVRLGLRENLAQFSLLVAVNALVGGMIGQERTVLPLLATRTFHLAAFTATLTFIVAFGAVKAATNFFAGTLSDRFGRKPVLVAGWLIGLPVPLLIIWAPSWAWIVFANVLLGVNQGLTWSTTVIMKIDLVGPNAAGSPWASTKPLATARSRSPRWQRVSSPGTRAFDPNRSSSASRTPRSASPCRRSSYARHMPTPTWKRATTTATRTPDRRCHPQVKCSD
jgi:hypothetical protein